MIKIIPIENRPGLSLVTAEMIDAGRKLVCESKRVSISFVQRKMQIGYNQAARIIEHLEKEGTVSVQSKSGVRTVLVDWSKSDAHGPDWTQRDGEYLK